MQEVLENNISSDYVKEEMNIQNIMKFTPELKDYIKSYIFINIDKPKNIIEERFSVYDGWVRGNVQRARLCIFHTKWNEKKECDDTIITSYFLMISPQEIHIHLPSNKGNAPDITISYPTKG